MDASNTHWTRAHEDYYSKQDWSMKPSIFATQIAEYIPAESKLLDLGAGQGQDSRYFSELGHVVTSPDLNEVAVRSAEQRAKEAGLVIEHNVVDAGKALPFEDASFDVVYSHLGLHYFGREKTRSVFEEVHRVLKPEGLVIFLANTIEDPEILTDDFKKLEDHFYQEMPTGLKKAYYTPEYARELTEGLFEPILVDAKGETYKDKIKTLIRFAGRKI